MFRIGVCNKMRRRFVEIWEMKDFGNVRIKQHDFSTVDIKYRTYLKLA